MLRLGNMINWFACVGAMGIGAGCAIALMAAGGVQRSATPPLGVAPVKAPAPARDSDRNVQLPAMLNRPFFLYTCPFRGVGREQ